MKIKDLLEVYFASHYAENKAEKTLQNYRRYATELALPYEDMNVMDMTPNIAGKAYSSWKQDSLHTANDVVIFARRVWNVGMKLGLVTDNPWKAVELAAVAPRQQTWSPAQVDAFVATGLSKPLWKPVAGILRTAYETAQRLTDIRLLEWRDIQEDGCSLNIHQQKTNSFVCVPLSEGYITFMQQHFEHMQHLSPWVFPKANGEPFSEVYLSQVVASIRDAAGLPKALQARDMRRTAITQMLDAGATTGEIRSISGHMNEASLRPYMVIHNRGRNQAAENAASKRQLFLDTGNK